MCITTSREILYDFYRMTVQPSVCTSTIYSAIVLLSILLMLILVEKQNFSIVILTNNNSLII